MATTRETKMDEIRARAESIRNCGNRQRGKVCPFCDRMLDLIVQDAIAALRQSDAPPAPGARKCPTCESPSPELHPAMQHEGEVQPCADAWHSSARVPVGFKRLETGYLVPAASTAGERAQEPLCRRCGLPESEGHEFGFRDHAFRAPDDCLTCDGYGIVWDKEKSLSHDCIDCDGFGKAKPAATPPATRPTPPHFVTGLSTAASPEQIRRNERAMSSSATPPVTETPRPEDWLKRQCARVKADYESLPKWLRDAATRPARDEEGR